MYNVQYVQYMYVYTKKTARVPSTVLVYHTNAVLVNLLDIAPCLAPDAGVARVNEAVRQRLADVTRYALR